MNITPNIEVRTRTIQEDVQVGYTLTLSYEEAAVLSAMAGGAGSAHVWLHALNTRRTSGPVSAPKWVCPFIDQLACIVPVNHI